MRDTLATIRFGSDAHIKAASGDLARQDRAVCLCRNRRPVHRTVPPGELLEGRWGKRLFTGD